MNGYYEQNNAPAPYRPPNMGYAPPPPPPPKKTSKLTWVVVAVIILLIAAYAILSNLFSPEKVAQKYFKAVFSSNWATAYEYLEVPEGALMTSAHFLEVHEEEQQANVTNLKVQESGSKSAADKNFMRTYTAYYTVKGENDSRTEDIQLVKQQEKNLLVFPKWKVSSGTVLAKNFVIFAPSGYEIAVDGEVLNPVSKGMDTINIEGTKDIASEELNGYDTYMENIFIGQHAVTASAENLETEEFTFDLYSDEMQYYKVDTLEISETAVSDMESTVQDFMRLIYKEALAQSKPSEDYFNYWAQEGADIEDTRFIQEAAKELHEDLTSALNDPHYYDKIQFTRMDFSKYQSQVNEIYNDESGNLYARLYVNYQYDYAYTGVSTSYQGITDKEDQENSGSSDMTITFKLEDGNWKICFADMDSVY